VRPLGRTAATGAFDGAAPPFGRSQVKASVPEATEPRSSTPIAEPVFPRPARHPSQNRRLIVLVFLPFAAGYYLSYLFRTINALISGQLTSDLALGAADLGLLTSVYFLTFAAAQLPIGVMLDHYGPRRVQSALLLLAAIGAALFGASHGFVPLVLARALIGLGVAASLTAGLKAIVLWFPKERVALVNGSMVMLGALGAVTATVPAELLLGWTGWRGLFELLAAVTAASAIAIYFLVPEVGAPGSVPKNLSSVSLKTVYADPRFWQLAPLSATSVGTAWSLQGLWAAPWLGDVAGLARSAVVQHLFVMAVALSAGALLLGVAADRLRRHGIGPQTLLCFVAIVFITTQLALILRLPVPQFLLWGVVAAVGAATVLSYAILAECFPKELAGRANAALNVFHIGGAFVLQYSTGLVIQQWTGHEGHYPAIAYQTAFALNLGLQAAALIWFMLSQVRASPYAAQLRR
jgi:sugar phosphate permease